MEKITEFLFHHNGDKILISDVLEDCKEVEESFDYPTTDGMLGCSAKSIDMPSGVYRVISIEKDYDNWGNRQKAMMILHTSIDYEMAILNTRYWHKYFDFMVDGGSCLVFSNSVLEDKINLNIFLDKWMSCSYDDNILKLENNNDKVIAFGTSTGFGDGFYEFSKLCVNNEIVGLRVTFIEE
jgi:hypothetical protein